MDYELNRRAEQSYQSAHSSKFLPTSPETDTFAPKRRPLNVVPSSNTSVAILVIFPDVENADPQWPGNWWRFRRSDETSSSTWNTRRARRQRMQITQRGKNSRLTPNFPTRETSASVWTKKEQMRRQPRQKGRWSLIISRLNGRDDAYKVFHTRCSQCGSRPAAWTVKFNGVRGGTSGKELQNKSLTPGNKLESTVHTDTEKE